MKGRIHSPSRPSPPTFEPLEVRNLLSGAGGMAPAVVSGRPVLTALAATPNPVTRGTALVLVASGVADRSGAGVAAVEFYIDSDGNGLFDNSTDVQVGADRSPRKGWSLSVDTTTFSAGAQAFFARVRDADGGVSKPAVTSVRIKKPGARHSYLGDYTGELRFSDGFVDVVDMRVTSQNGGYLSGTFDQATAGYSFTFTATILKNNKISIVFGGDGSGTGDGTISADLNTISGTFASRVDGKSYKGTFRVTKV